MDKILILCVGASNSGKSTWALDYNSHCYDTYIEPYLILNADLLRKCVTGDITNQDQNHQVFQILEKMCAYFMEQSYNLIIDNTNVSRQNRKMWIKLARQYGYKIIINVFKTPLEVCLARNGERERKVDENVILNQFNKFQYPEPGEFDEIIEIT